MYATENLCVTGEEIGRSAERRCARRRDVQRQSLRYLVWEKCSHPPKCGLGTLDVIAFPRSGATFRSSLVIAFHHGPSCWISVRSEASASTLERHGRKNHTQRNPSCFLGDLVVLYVYHCLSVYLIHAISLSIPILHPCDL